MFCVVESVVSGLVTEVLSYTVKRQCDPRGADWPLQHLLAHVAECCCREEQYILICQSDLRSPVFTSEGHEIHNIYILSEGEF